MPKIGLSEEELYPWIEVRTDYGSPEYTYCFETEISSTDFADLKETERRFFSWQKRLKGLLKEMQKKD